MKVINAVTKHRLQPGTGRITITSKTRIVQMSEPARNDDISPSNFNDIIAKPAKSSNINYEKQTLLTIAL